MRFFVSLETTVFHDKNFRAWSEDELDVIYEVFHRSGQRMKVESQRILKARLPGRPISQIRKAFKDLGEIGFVMQPEPEREIRLCMTCGDEFESSGIHNRRCNQCHSRQTDNYIGYGSH